jgi:uncharacterized protein YacL
VSTHPGPLDGPPLVVPNQGGSSAGPLRTGPRTPAAVLEVLRLLVVVFFAGAGYQLGASTGHSRPILGALNGTALGLVLGSGTGYVLGGVLGRRTAASAEAARSRLRDVSAEQLVAGAFGTIGGVLLGAGVAWPVFLVPQAYIAFPLFGFVVVTLGYVGFGIGASKRDGVLALFGQRAGITPRPVATAALDRVVDTSVAVDGRLLDVVRAGFLHGRVLVPTPVLAELQGLADAGDDLRRAKGRRGLELLEALQREPALVVEVLDVDVPGVHEVDAKLVRICLDRGAALLTLDTNLARAAGLAGVAVLNLHALALALRPVVAAGDEVPVLLLKAGREAGQAVGYLDDGSMVVVERVRPRVGTEVPVLVTSVLTTSNGRLVFGRPADEPDAAATRQRADSRPTPAAMPARRSSRPVPSAVCPPSPAPASASTSTPSSPAATAG